MQIKISSKHMELTPAIEEYAEKKVERLTRFFDRIQQVEVVIDKVKNGYNVEIIAARRIGRETVTYVSNVFKYYVGYQIISERADIRSQRHGETLQGCL